uniref:Alpha-1,3-glucosyltransferase n=1 Tax=Meloidogyne floridensis TaxID=298350 RepID=A0A915P9S3_9BILA
EYSHSILPDISPLITLIIIFVILIASFWRFKDIEEYSHTDFLLISMLLSAYPFFLFGWHVHEKAILMLFFPLAILSIKDSRFMEPFSLMFLISTFAQFNLLFTPLEHYLIKISFIFGIFAVGIFVFNYLWHISPSELIRCPVAFLLFRMVLLAEFYSLIGHKILSLPETTEFDERSIRYIAGIDLSASTNHPSFGVVGLTVMAYPSMKVVYCADEPVLLSALGGVMPYLPEYFAIREAKPLLRVIRRCGLACHIGYELGIPTIGVAKKLNEAPLLYSGYCTREDLAEINSEIYEKCDDSEGSATMFYLNWNKKNENNDQIKLPSLAVIHTKSSKKAFYVSVGFGIDFVSASKIAFNCIGKNSYNVNPIRLSDLRSTKRIGEIFEH